MYKVLIYACLYVSMSVCIVSLSNTRPARRGTYGVARIAFPGISTWHVSCCVSLNSAQEVMDGYEEGEVMGMGMGGDG